MDKDKIRASRARYAIIRVTATTNMNTHIGLNERRKHHKLIGCAFLIKLGGNNTSVKIIVGILFLPTALVIGIIKRMLAFLTTPSLTMSPRFPASS